MHELQVLRGLQGVPYLHGIVAAGPLHGVLHPVDAVIGHDGVHELHALGAGLLLVLLEETGEGRVRLVHVAHPVGILHGVAGDLPHEVAVAVAAHDLNVQVKLPGLLHRQGEALAHGGDNQHVGVGLLDHRQLGAEVHVLGPVAFVGHDLPAVLLE